MFVGALTDPVTNEIEVGDLVHVNLRVETFERDALHGFIHPQLPPRMKMARRSRK